MLPPARTSGPPADDYDDEPTVYTGAVRAPEAPEESSESPAGPPEDPPSDPPEDPPQDTAPPPSGGGGGKARVAVRTFGEILITLGVVMLLFVVYELYVTNLMSQQKQREASASLDERWSQEREVHAEPLSGEAFARLYIPSFGVDWNFTIQQGVDADTLEVGPGHYTTSAMPGEAGNFAVAGHRVGKGAPFNDLDLLASCDAVVVETVESFFVYRVVPMADEVNGWADGKGADPRCAGVAPLSERDPVYGETVGRRIVTPDRGDAVAPVPYEPGATVAGQREAELLTLTTCHPRFSDRERMIIHGVLTDVYDKERGAGYEELLREIGEA